jgi:hypothetical protein
VRTSEARCPVEELPRHDVQASPEDVTGSWYAVAALGTEKKWTSGKVDLQQIGDGKFRFHYTAAM